MGEIRKVIGKEAGKRTGGDINAGREGFNGINNGAIMETG